MPTGYFSATVVQGSGMRALMERLTRSFSGSTERTWAFTFWPFWITSRGWLNRPQVISERWTKPSTGPRLTKTPKSVTSTTVPSTTWPGSGS